jgi:hypothetical protein
MFSQTPGVRDCFDEGSWGQSQLSEADVDFFELETSTSTSGWSSLSDVHAGVTAEDDFQTQLATRPYRHVVMVQPGTNFAATAWTPGEYSRYQGDAITWMTIMHEVGHNLGISHAGGLTSAGTYQAYQDDAAMGFQRSWRAPDYSAPARYNLGWIADDQAKQFPANSIARIRALNEGPAADDNVLIYTAACSFCDSLAHPGRVGGTLYMSLRVNDPSNTYGVSNTVDILANDDTGTLMTMIDRVHVHFQAAGSIKTELWKTLSIDEEWTVTGSSGTNALHIKACEISTRADGASSPASETALVAIGTDSDSVDCGPRPPSSPPSPPSPSPSPPAPSPPPGCDDDWPAQYTPGGGWVFSLNGVHLASCQEAHENGFCWVPYIGGGGDPDHGEWCRATCVSDTCASVPGVCASTSSTSGGQNCPCNLVGDERFNFCTGACGMYDNGDTYEGPCSNDMKEGEGTYTRANGDQYVGAFSNDAKSGHGVFTYANNDVFDGTFSNDKRVRGTYSAANGDVYTGPYNSNEEKEGQGVYTSPSQAHPGSIGRFEGGFHNDRKEGLGIFTWGDGSVMTSGWCGGIPRGPGVVISGSGPPRARLLEHGRNVGATTVSNARSVASTITAPSSCPANVKGHWDEDRDNPLRDHGNHDGIDAHHP